MLFFPVKAGVMKKTIVAFAIVLTAAGALRGQDWTDSWAKWHRPSRFSIGLFGGTSVFSPILRSNGSYRSSWNELELASVQESAVLNLEGKSGFTVGFSLEYVGESGWGFQILIGYRKRAIETASETSFSWRWRDGRNDQRSSSWTGTGSLTTIPVAMNGLIRLLSTPRLTASLSGGAVLHYNEIRDVASTIVWGFTRLDPSSNQQWVDALAVPIRIEKTEWLNLGLNGGLRFEAPLLPALLMGLDVRYYHLPPQTLSWTPIPVEGDGLYFSAGQPLMRTVRFETRDAADIVNGNTLRNITIIPSFFQVTFGLKVLLTP
jgi:hypothetical protein